MSSQVKPGNTANASVNSSRATASAVPQAAAAQVKTQANAATSKMQTVAKSVQSGIQQASDKVKNFVLLKQSGITLFVILVLALIAFVVIYIIIQIRKSSFEKTIIVPEVLQMNDSKRVPYVKVSTEIPATKNGHEFTYSFWIYLTEYYEQTNEPKLVFYRGTSGGNTYGSSNPIVFMDGHTNKMYIAALTNKSVPSVTTLNDILGTRPEDQTYLISTIDYVPLQRWVHVAFSLQDSNLTVYLDGDIYSVKNIADMPFSNGQRPMFRGTLGDVTVGSPQYTIDGFISKLEFFNYMVPQKQITSLYKNGPLKNSLLRMLGISQYGVRNPIYRIGGEDR